jgi:hypothetical protein
MMNYTSNYFIGILFLLFLISIMTVTNSNAETCVSNNPDDKDDDGIPNEIEVNGYDVNNDGIVDLDLQSKGANPNHKDLFLTIDYLENRKPLEDALNSISIAFDNAPLCNPDGIPGATLHIEVDESILRTTDNKVLNKNEVISIKKNHLLTAIEKLDVNQHAIHMAKEKIYYYGFIGDQHIAGWSGQSDGIPGCLPSASPEGKTFFVTLGGPGWTRDPDTGERVGNVKQQEGTIHHEFGHALGLSHDNQCSGLNYKANYLSTLNYAFQVPSLIPDRPLDYSRCQMETLKETELNESKGITIPCDPWKETIIEAAGIVNPFACDNPRAVPINRPVDFNLNGIIDSAPVAYDLNCDGEKTALVADKNDWDNIKFLKLDGNEGGLILGNNSEQERGVKLDGNEEGGRLLGNNSVEEQEELKGEDILAHKLSLVSRLQKLLSEFEENPEPFTGGEVTPERIAAINNVNRTIGDLNTTALVNNYIENEGGLTFFFGPPTLGEAVVSDNVDVPLTILQDIKRTLTEEGGISLSEGIGATINSQIVQIEGVVNASRWEG